MHTGTKTTKLYGEYRSKKHKQTCKTLTVTNYHTQCINKVGIAYGDVVDSLTITSKDGKLSIMEGGKSA